MHPQFEIDIYIYIITRQGSSFFYMTTSNLVYGTYPIKGARKPVGIRFNFPIYLNVNEILVYNIVLLQLYHLFKLFYL
jgi:hypothetical protein